VRQCGVSASSPGRIGTVTSPSRPSGVHTCSILGKRNAMQRCLLKSCASCGSECDVSRDQRPGDQASSQALVRQNYGDIAALSHNVQVLPRSRLPILNRSTFERNR
jgi:hypothetical protein